MDVKIIFFNWDSIYSKLIRFHTGSKWTHVGIVGAEDQNGVYCFEALNKGLVKSYYSNELLRTWEVQGIITIKTVTLRTTPAELLKVCESYEGAPYDWVSILNIALYSVLGKMALNFSGPRAVICSEFVARVLYELSNKRINFEEEYDKKFDLVTPADIFRSVFLK